MRKNLAIILLSIHLTGNTELGQLFKLPRLVQHFFQHQRQDPGINFINFIVMHYAGDDGTTADDDFDNKLPCHSINCNTLSIVYSPMIKDLSLTTPQPSPGKQYNDCLQSAISSKHVLMILQPPRQA